MAPAGRKRRGVAGLPVRFGLGYTTFSLGEAVVPSGAAAGDDVVVHVPVTNTGARAGREVVQVYLARAESAVEPACAGWPDSARPAWHRVKRAPSPSASGPARSPTTTAARRTEPGTFQVVIGRHAEDAFREYEINLGPGAGPVGSGQSLPVVGAS